MTIFIHHITRNTGGKNESSWIQSVCSCGWKGEKKYAYEDYQHFLIDKQEIKHYHETIKS